jgi:hypothetical protein
MFSETCCVLVMYCQCDDSTTTALCSVCCRCEQLPASGMECACALALQSILWMNALAINRYKLEHLNTNAAPSFQYSAEMSLVR